MASELRARIRLQLAEVALSVGSLLLPDAWLLQRGRTRAAAIPLLPAATVDDLDFFTFPFFGNKFGAEKALDAPVDIWMMPALSKTLAADMDNAKAYLEFWAKGSTRCSFTRPTTASSPRLPTPTRPRWMS